MILYLPVGMQGALGMSIWVCGGSEGQRRGEGKSEVLQGRWLLRVGCGSGYKRQ